MAIRKIAQIGHPVLRQRAREVTREELASPAMQQLIDDLIETMHDADGAGLAAIQIYEPIRIVAIEVRNNPRYPYKPPIPLTILVNPVLTPVGDEMFEYMTSSTYVAEGYGDPDFVVSVPPEQYLSDYVFFADPTYPETNLVMIRAKGTQCDGAPELELSIDGKAVGTTQVTNTAWGYVKIPAAITATPATTSVVKAMIIFPRFSVRKCAFITPLAGSRFREDDR